MKKSFFLFLFIILLSLSACGGSNVEAQTSDPQQTCPTAAVCPTCASPTGGEAVAEEPTLPPPTATPDPCAPENLEGSVDEVHRYMREFDDASALAGSVGRDELSDHIANMQRIRREAEDQFVPICLADLKAYQLSHMNVVINTLISFMGGSSQEAVDQGIQLAREYHDQYTLELADVLGLDVVPVITATPLPTAGE